MKRDQSLCPFEMHMVKFKTLVSLFLVPPILLRQVMSASQDCHLNRGNEETTKCPQKERLFQLA